LVIGISVVNFKANESEKGVWGVLRGASICPLQMELADHRELMACYFSEREKFEAAIGEGTLELEPGDVLELSFEPVPGWIFIFVLGFVGVHHLHIDTSE